MYNLNALQPESKSHYSGHAASTSVQNFQIAPATQPTQEVVSRQNVHRAVAEAQRNGKISK